MQTPINQPSVVPPTDGSPVPVTDINAATNPTTAGSRKRRPGKSFKNRFNSSGKLNQSSSTIRPDASNQPKQPISLDTVQFQLQTLLASALSDTELVQQFVEINSQLTNAIWSGHFAQNEAGQIVCTAVHNPIAQQNLGITQSSLLPTVAATFETKKAKITRDDDLSVITTPVFTHSQTGVDANECFCIALNLGNEAAEPFLLITQLIAATLAQRLAKSKTGNLEWQIDSTTAIAELMSKIVNTTGATAAATVATNELAMFLKSPLVAIGYANNANSKRTRLLSVSGVAEITKKRKANATDSIGVERDFNPRLRDNDSDHRR